MRLEVASAYTLIFFVMIMLCCFFSRVYANMRWLCAARKSRTRSGFVRMVLNVFTVIEMFVT